MTDLPDIRVHPLQVLRRVHQNNRGDLQKPCRANSIPLRLWTEIHQLREISFLINCPIETQDSLAGPARMRPDPGLGFYSGLQAK